MSKTIQFFMDRPELVDKLPLEMKQGLLAAVREELARVRGGAIGAMPQSAVDDLVRAVPDDLMAAIVADNRRSTSEPGWLPPAKPDYSRVTDPDKANEPAKPRGSGWQTASPLEGSVRYIRHVDAVAEHFNQIDRAEQKAKFTRRI